MNKDPPEQVPVQVSPEWRQMRPDQRADLLNRARWELMQQGRVKVRLVVVVTKQAPPNPTDLEEGEG